jgi:hypothetical protein
MAALEMPIPLLVAARKFEYLPKQNITPVNGGFIQVVDRTTPFWIAEYATGKMTEADFDIFNAWLDELEGASGTFLAYDPRRPRPMAYMSQVGNTTPWGASPTITAASIANGTLTLGSLTNPSTITKGDYISFKIGNVWYLHRAIENVTTTATATVKVRPRPLVESGFPVAIRIVKACAEMKVTSRPVPELSVEGGDMLRFSAVQHLNRAT